MKHPGPLKPNRPAPRYWRDTALTAAGGAGWMLLSWLVDAGRVDQVVMLVIVIVAVPSAIYVTSNLGYWRSRRFTLLPRLERDGLMGLGTLWPMDTVWIIDATREREAQRSSAAPPATLSPVVRRRLRKDVR